MSFLKADEGVSESLGFVLVALILTTVIAAILMIGYPIYQQSINEGHMQNMEEGFYLLSANANKVALYESPIQSSELKLYGGVLSLHDDGYIKIYYKYYDSVAHVDKWADDPITIPSHKIMEYSLNNDKVAYVMGGVCKKEGGSSIVLKDPIAYQYMTGSTRTMVIPLIDYANQIEALAGTEFTRVELRSPYYSRAMSTLIYPNAERIDTVKEIQIEMTSEYNDCLGRYFTDKLGFYKEPNGVNGLPVLRLDCSANPITLYVPHCQLYVEIN